MNLHTYAPGEALPPQVLCPQQRHTSHIVEVKTGKEDLSETDGLYAKRSAGFVLGVYTADCTPIAFWNDQYYGIVHAG